MARIVVTGASTGIGEATVRPLTAEGYEVVATARREGPAYQPVGADGMQPFRRGSDQARGYRCSGRIPRRWPGCRPSQCCRRCTRPRPRGRGQGHRLAADVRDQRDCHPAPHAGTPTSVQGERRRSRVPHVHSRPRNLSRGRRLYGRQARRSA